MKFLVCAFMLICAVFADEKPKTKRGLLLGDHSLGSLDSLDHSSWLDSHDDISLRGNEHGLGLGLDDNLDEHGHIHHITLHKKVHVPIPHPVPVPVEKKIPYPVKVPVPYKVDKPYPVHVPAPYPVHIDKPYPVKVEKVVKVPYKVPVKVPVPIKVPYAIPKPYPVHVEKPVAVHVPEINIIKKPYPVYIKQHDDSYDSLGFDSHSELSLGDSLSLGDDFGHH